MKKSAIALTTLALLLGACAEDTATTTDPNTAAVENETGATATGETAAAVTPTASNTPADTLVIMRSSDIPTLDPGTTYDNVSGEVVENMYETLLTYKGDSLTEIEGLLATDWEYNDDGTQYRFTLRPDVKFHSGNTMTCADAEYTFQRNLVTNTAESGNWFMAESLLGTSANANDDDTVTWERIDNAVQCDGETLVFNLPKADPAFLTKLIAPGQSIVDSKHAIAIGEWDGTEATWKDAVGVDLTGSALAKDPSGTGPYQLVSQDVSGVTAKAFADYWGGEPSIKNVVLRIVPEESSRVQALLNGDADMATSGGREVIETQLAGQPGIKVIDDLKNLATYGFTMNQNLAGSTNLGSGTWGDGIPENFFQDVNMRKCFTLAFDYQAYIDQVLGGKAEQLNVMLPSSFLGYDASQPVPQQDMAAAEEACKAAHSGAAWENGFELTAAHSENSPTQKTALEIMKMQIEGMNPKFRMNIVGMPWSDVVSKAAEQPMIYVGWGPSYADPDYFIHPFYHTDGFYNARAGFNEPELDALIDEARSTIDEQRRKELYSEITKMVNDKQLYLMTPTGVDITALRDNIGGAEIQNTHPLRGGLWLWKDLSKL